MIIKVNGDPQVVDNVKITVADLLARNHVQAPEMVSVQRNGEFVERSDYAATRLAENDEIDFLYFMGGGQAQ